MVDGADSEWVSWDQPDISEIAWIALRGALGKP